VRLPYSFDRNDHEEHLYSGRINDDFNDSMYYIDTTRGNNVIAITWK
jgi:hypothetical protein